MDSNNYDDGFDDIEAQIHDFLESEANETTTGTHSLLNYASYNSAGQQLPSLVPSLQEMNASIGAKRGKISMTEVLELIVHVLQKPIDGRLSTLLRTLRNLSPRCKSLKIPFLLKSANMGTRLGLLEMVPEPNLSQVVYLPSHLQPPENVASGYLQPDTCYRLTARGNNPAVLNSMFAKANRESNEADQQSFVPAIAAQEDFVPGVAIDCIGSDGKLIKRFKSIDEVRLSGFNVDGTMACIRGQVQLSQGLVWKYYNAVPLRKADTIPTSSSSSAPRQSQGRGRRVSADGPDKDYGSDFEEFDIYGIDDEDETESTEPVSRAWSSSSAPRDSAQLITAAIELFMSDPLVLMIMKQILSQRDPSIGINFVDLTNNILNEVGQNIVSKNSITLFTKKCVQLKLIDETYRPGGVVSQHKGGRGMGRRAFNSLYYGIGKKTLAKYSFGLQVVGCDKQTYREFDDTLFGKKLSFIAASEMFGVHISQVFENVMDFGTQSALRTYETYNDKQMSPESWVGDLTIRLFMRLKSSSNASSTELGLQHALFDANANTPATVAAVSQMSGYNSLYKSVEDMYVVGADLELRAIIQEGVDIRKENYIYWRHSDTAEPNNEDGYLRKRNQISKLFCESKSAFSSASLYSLEASNRQSPSSFGVVAKIFDIFTVDMSPPEEVVPVGDNHQAIIDTNAVVPATTEGIASIQPSDVNCNSNEYLLYFKIASVLCLLPGQVIRIPIRPNVVGANPLKPGISYSCITQSTSKIYVNRDKRLYGCVVCLVYNNNLLDTSTVDKIAKIAPYYQDIDALVFDGEQTHRLPIKYCVPKEDIIKESWIDAVGDIGRALQSIQQHVVGLHRNALWSEPEFRSFMRLHHRMAFDQRNMLHRLFSISTLSKTKILKTVIKFHFDYLPQLENQYGCLALCNVLTFSRWAQASISHQQEFGNWYFKQLFTQTNPGQLGNNINIDSFSALGEANDSWDTYFGVKYHANTAVGALVHARDAIPIEKPAKPVVVATINDDDDGQRSTRKRIVEQIDMDTGRVVRRYPSGKSAADSLGVYQSYISSCCRGLKDSTGGFKWRFYEGTDPVDFQDPSYLSIEELKAQSVANAAESGRRRSKVADDGEDDTERKSGIPAKLSLTDAGDEGGSGGAAEEGGNEDDTGGRGAKVREKKQKPVEQIDLDSGEVVRSFPSASAAGKFYNIAGLQQRISMCCRGVLKQTGGYKWRFSNRWDEADERMEASAGATATSPSGASANALAGRKRATADSLSSTSRTASALAATSSDRFRGRRGRILPVDLSQFAAKRDKAKAKLAAVGDWHDANWTHCLCRSRWRIPKSLFHICLEAIWYLKEKKGSTASAIRAFILVAYPKLPYKLRRSLLREALARCLASNCVVFDEQRGSYSLTSAGLTELQCLSEASYGSFSTMQQLQQREQQPDQQQHATATSSDQKQQTTISKRNISINRYRPVESDIDLLMKKLKKSDTVNALQVFQLMKQEYINSIGFPATVEQLLLLLTASQKASLTESSILTALTAGVSEGIYRVVPPATEGESMLQMESSESNVALRFQFVDQVRLAIDVENKRIGNQFKVAMKDICLDSSDSEDISDSDDDDAEVGDSEEGEGDGEVEQEGDKVGEGASRPQKRTRQSQRNGSSVRKPQRKRRRPGDSSDEDEEEPGFDSLESDEDGDDDDESDGYGNSDVDSEVVESVTETVEGISATSDGEGEGEVDR